MNAVFVVMETLSNYTIYIIFTSIVLPLLLATYIQMIRGKIYVYLFVLSNLPVVISWIVLAIYVFLTGIKQGIGVLYLLKGAIGICVAGAGGTCFCSFIYSVPIVLYHLIRWREVRKWVAVCLGSLLLYFGIVVLLVPYGKKLARMLELILS